MLPDPSEPPTKTEQLPCGEEATTSIDESLLDGLDDINPEDLRPRRPSGRPTNILSITELGEQAKANPSRELIFKKLAGIPSEPTSLLLSQIRTATGPLTLWAVHVELDTRNVPPCLRRRNDPPHSQFGYIAWLADILWLARRHPDHKTTYIRWRGLFVDPKTPRWHKAAKWIFVEQLGHRGGHHNAQALGLSDKQRQPLKTMPTKPMQGDRKRWRDFEKSRREQLETWVIDHPDRSDRRTTAEVVEGRE